MKNNNWTNNPNQENNNNKHSATISSDKIGIQSFSDAVLNGDSKFPFPLECIPENLKNYCQAVAECLCVPVEYTVIAGLFACAVANGGKRRFKNGPYNNLSIFWNVMLADTGKQKTPPQKYMLKPLFERDKKSQEHYNRKKAKFNRLPVNEKKTKEFPTKKQFLYSDSTAESINRQHLINELACGGVGVYSDEISKYLGSLGKYNKASDSEKASRLERYSNVPIMVNRVGNGDGESSFLVYNSPENLLGTHQPKRLHLIVNKDSIVSGDFARYNFYFPEDYKKGGFPKVVPNDLEMGYYELINRIYAFDVADLYEDDFKNDVVTYVPSKGATVLFNDFKQECDKVHNESPEGEYLRGIEGKTLEKASRNALLFQAIDDTNNPNLKLEICELNMKRGIELAKYHFFSSVRVAKLINNPGVRKLSTKELKKQLMDSYPNINKTKLANLLGIQRTSLYK